MRLTLAELAPNDGLLLLQSMAQSDSANNVGSVCVEAFHNFVSISAQIKPICLPAEEL